MIEQLPASGWPTDENRPLLLMSLDPDVLAERFGLDFSDDEDGLGPLRLAVVRLPFGVVRLIRHDDAPFEGTSVYVDAAANLELAHRAVVGEFGLTNQDIGWAVRSAGLLEIVRDSARLTELLATSFEFDVRRVEADDTASVASGLPLEPLAGDFAGGRFYLCGDAGVERPVLYASSEGQAGLIATNLREALQLVLGLPYWQDCLGFSGDGRLDVMLEAARRSRATDPRPASQREEAAALLSLDIPAPDVLLSRLHAAGLRSAPGYVFRDETGEYEGLFGSWLPERNPRWRDA